MPLPGRIFADDEELGKKDDEYRPSANGTIPIPGLSWAQWRASPRMRRRRIGIVLLALFGLYVFVKNIPTDLKPIGERIDLRIPGQTVDGHQLASYQQVAPEGAPPQDDESVIGEGGARNHYHNGPIKWYFLAATLQTASRKMGGLMNRKNVVFAAANLQSLARLVPMACEMARYNRNVVHMLVMGRHDLTIDELKKINGADDSCDIYWHDARPDYSLYSSDDRMALSVSASLMHIQNFLHPQLYIIEEPRHEDAPFIKGFHEQPFQSENTVIHLPRDAVQKLLWVTRLDSGSLTAWHNTYVDILIHAPPESSGSLLRLLKTIERADYFGARYPHLTIELPPDLDPATESFLENFIWPPQDPGGGPHTSLLTLRRRIPTAQATPSEASARLVESFYPSRSHDSHVLLLSAQVELSPLYYQYLIFHTLEYKYSQYGAGTRESSGLMGISLVLPSRLLDDETPLIPPPLLSKDTHAPGSRQTNAGNATPFLWQAPDVHATLYFGDKWREFHSFLSQRLTTESVALPKIISPNYPAFAEHMLEIMRVRNYFVLHPHIAGYAIATVHNELYQFPEEFDIDDSEGPSSAIPADTDEPFLTPLPPKAPPPAREDPLAYIPLHALLPNKGDLPELSRLPLLAYDGQITYPTAALKAAKLFTNKFRVTIGGCPSGADLEVVEYRANDLFCFGINMNDGSLGEAFTNRDAVIPEAPIGFGSARTQTRPAGAGDEIESGHDGNIKHPMSEGKKKMMRDEAAKHLQRHNKMEEDRKML